MKYNAFISYSHAQDSDLAPHLETALETFAKPLFKQRALNIFRDANDLSASPDLWGKIEEGLINSEYFILLASPKAAQSRWCKKEVDCWKANKSMSNFLIVITDGELSWDESTSDFDWSKTTAIPDNLSGTFINEPLFVDFRNHKNEESGLEYPDFRTKTVLLAATIHGKTVGNMIGENVRQHKRMLRIRNSAITILSVLLLAVGYAGYFANEQRKEALLSSYISNSQAQFNEDPTKALRLAEYAYKFSKANNFNTDQAEDQLIKVFYNNSHFYNSHDDFELQKDSAFNFPIQKEFNKMMISYDENHQLILDDSINKIIFERDLPPADILSFSPNGKFIVEKLKYYGYARDQGLIIQVFDLKGKRIAKAESFEPHDYPQVKFSNNGRRFLLSGYGVEETIIGSINDYNENYLKTILSNRRDVTSIDLSSDGMMASIGYSNGEIELIVFDEYGTEYFQSYILSGHHTESIIAIKFSDDGLFLYSQSEHYKRKWLTNNYMPYIQMINSPSMRDFGTIEGGKTYHNEGIIMPYGDNEGLELIKFNDDQSESETITTIENVKHKSETNYAYKNRYFATENGLFNFKNERLISYNFPVTTATLIQITGFSEDNDYFFSESKLYFLDPELIIKRFNDSTKFGEIELFTKEERAQYLIPDDY